jgi:hypothetical protein
MSTKIRATSTKTGADMEIQGSDGRMDVSARVDSRGHHNSREEGMSFSLFFEMTQAATGEFVAYWRNASPTLTLVISEVHLSMAEEARAKLHFVTGVAASGTELTPLNLNKTSSRVAPDDSVVMAMEGLTSTPISGLTSAGVIDAVSIAIGSDFGTMHLDGRVRLGQGDAVAVEAEDIASTADVYGTIYGYYE